MAVGGSDVVGAARLNLAGPDREPTRAGKDLHVAALGLVYTRVPQVMPTVVVLVDPVDGDQRAVQRQMRPALLLGLFEHLMQLGACAAVISIVQV